MAITINTPALHTKFWVEQKKEKMIIETPKQNLQNIFSYGALTLFYPNPEIKL